MTNTYGINSILTGYRDTSNTERGAKNHATRNGYNEVYIRFNNGYHVERVATKVNNKWINEVNL